MSKKIKCSNPDCKATWGKLLGNKTIDLARGDQQMTIIGSDFQIVGTCPRCGNKTTAIIEDGALNMDDVSFKEDGTTDDNGDPITPAPTPKPADSEDDAIKNGGKPNEEPAPNPDEPAARKYTSK